MPLHASCSGYQAHAQTPSSYRHRGWFSVPSCYGNCPAPLTPVPHPRAPIFLPGVCPSAVISEPTGRETEAQPGSAQGHVLWGRDWNLAQAAWLQSCLPQTDLATWKVPGDPRAPRRGRRRRLRGSHSRDQVTQAPGGASSTPPVPGGPGLLLGARGLFSAGVGPALGCWRQVPRRPGVTLPPVSPFSSARVGVAWSEKAPK